MTPEEITQWVNDAKRRSFENGWKTAVDKACEWLDSYFEDGYDLCNDFRKAMEE